MVLIHLERIGEDPLRQKKGVGVLFPGRFCPFLKGKKSHDLVSNFINSYWVLVSFSILHSRADDAGSLDLLSLT